MQVTGMGSIMCFHFAETSAEAIHSHMDVEGSDGVLSGLLHLFLMEEGYNIARRGFVALSLVLTEKELEGFVRAFRSLL